MAAAFVSAAAAQDGTLTVSSLTISSVNGGAGNLLVIAVGWRQNAGQTISNVTYNGSATGITLVHSGGSSGGNAALYYLVSPSGTADVVVTFSANTIAQATAIVLSGVDTGSPLADSDEVADSSTGTGTATPDVTVDADDFVVDVLVKRTPIETVTIGANQTQRSTHDVSATYQTRTSTQDGADGGAMSWTWTTSGNYYHASAAFTGAAAGGVVVPVIAHHLKQQGFL